MGVCGECEHVDYSALYSTDPLQYKCGLYGFVVGMDDCCWEERGTDGIQRKSNPSSSDDDGH